MMLPGTLLAHAADQLLACGRTSALGGGIDLARVCVVTPGRRLGRLLLRELTERAAAEGRWLSPPRLATPVQIPEIVMGPAALTGAGAMQRAVAWKRALGSGSAEAAEAALVIGTGRDAAIEDGRWIDDVVSKLARAMVLPAEVPTRCTAVTVQGDDERWIALDRVRERYERVLEEAGLCDPRLEELRRLRASVEVAADAPERIILAGVLELDRAARAALDLFARREAGTASGGSRPAVFGAEGNGRGGLDQRIVVVSAGDGVGLDAYGSVSPDRRPDESPASGIELAEDQIAWCGGPADAAACAIDMIAAWHRDGSVVSSGDVVVCSPDAAFTAELGVVSAGVHGFAVHDAAGVALSATGVGRLMQALAVYLREGSRVALSRLVKHGAVQRVIEATDLGRANRDWLGAVDSEATESPRATCGGENGGADSVCAAAAAALASIVDLEDNGPRSVREQAVRLGRALGVLLADAVDRDGALVLAGAITEVGECDLVMGGTVSLADAADLLIDALGAAVRAAEGVAGAIDVLGWLDAAYDPAPNLVLLGMNSGVMPARPGADPWLNETVLRALGMFTSEHAAVRDVYLLRHMLDVRRGTGRVCAVVAGSDADGATLWPSPFLFACSDAQALQRARRMSHGERSVARARAQRVEGAGERDDAAFPLAPVAGGEPVRAVSVTAFKDYIASPYAFYVRHALKLNEASEPDRETGYNTLGTLVHELLRDFAGSRLCNSDNAEQIEAWLLERLDERAAQWPQGLVRSTAALQQAVLRRRLSRFASLQSRHRREGWQISATEWKPSTPVSLRTSRGEIQLRGRIDRIDRRGGAVMVLDYKTSDRKKKAGDAFKKGRKGMPNSWRDLQLPLYRYMLIKSGFDAGGRVDDASEWVLGYWPLCKEREKPALVTLDVASEDLAAAEERAVEIVERVLAGEFSEIGDVADYGGSISRLCGLRLLEDDDEEAET